MSKISVFLILLVAILSSGCSINHPVARDYHQYLLNNDTQSTLPNIKKTESIRTKPKASDPAPNGNRLPPGVTIIGQ